MPTIERAKEILLELTASRGPEKTICPSEAARLLSHDGWRELLPLVRQAADELRQAGQITIEQQGWAIDPSDAKGPVRYRSARSASPAAPSNPHPGGIKFTDEEIAHACELKRLGLPWLPRPGHYVWDKQGLIEKGSPFQPGVYFILDLKHFLRRAGTMDALREQLVWLPTWEDARTLLAQWGVGSEMIAEHIQQARAFECGNERLVLYRLLAHSLAST